VGKLLTYAEPTGKTEQGASGSREVF
jgi:hypothetical protein